MLNEKFYKNLAACAKGFKDLCSNRPLVLKSALLKHSLCVLILKVQNNSFISAYFLFMSMCFVQRNIFNVLSFWSDCILPKKCEHHHIADKSSVVWCLTEMLQIIAWHVAMPMLDVASDWLLPSSKLSLPEVALKMLFSPVLFNILIHLCLHHVISASENLEKYVLKQT